jgi:hypothetical protein
MKKRKVIRAFMLGFDCPGVYWGIFSSVEGARQVAKDNKLRVIPVRITVRRKRR